MTENERVGVSAGAAAPQHATDRRAKRTRVDADAALSRAPETLHSPRQPKRHAVGPPEEAPPVYYFEHGALGDAVAQRAEGRSIN